jgi:hypothetical protein
MKFSPGDQRAFARLSGDFNPIHVDPAAARLTAAGEPIVHGLHALLRTLDQHFSRTSPPSTIDARFERPIIVGDTVQAVRTSPTTVALTLDGDLSLATISVERLRSSQDDVPGLAAGRRSKRSSVKPAVWTLADIGDASGVVTLNQSNAIARMFPRASRAFGVESIRALAAISRLVGMECPGRDSLLSALSLRVDRTNAGKHLQWRVARVDRRFALVRIDVDGGGVNGIVDAFLRPSPVPLPSWASVAAAVRAEEFAGQRALIVGGSRGLGAATAQLIAAGGGAALATFSAGKTEASTLRARDSSWRWSASMSRGIPNFSTRSVSGFGRRISITLQPPGFSDAGATRSMPNSFGFLLTFTLNGLPRFAAPRSMRYRRWMCSTRQRPASALMQSES